MVTPLSTSSSRNNNNNNNNNKQAEKKIYHVAHKAGYDVVYYTNDDHPPNNSNSNNHSNNNMQDDCEAEEQVDDHLLMMNHHPDNDNDVTDSSPASADDLSPPQHPQKNGVRPTQSSRSLFGRPARLSSPSANINRKKKDMNIRCGLVAAHDKTNSHDSNSNHNNTSHGDDSSSSNVSNNSQKETKKPVISPPSHAFLFRQDNPHYYSPPSSTASSGGPTSILASISNNTNTTTPTQPTLTTPLTSQKTSSSSCLVGVGAGFGIVRSPKQQQQQPATAATMASTTTTGNTRFTMRSPLLSPKAAGRTTATATAAGGICEEEEECHSPTIGSSRNGNGGGLAVPFAQTPNQQQHDNDNDDFNETMDTVKAVVHKQPTQQQQSLFTFTPQSKQGRVILTNSTTAMLSPKVSSSGSHDATSPSFLGIMSSVSSLTAASQQPQAYVHTGATLAPPPPSSLLLGPESTQDTPGSSQYYYDYENDPHEANRAASSATMRPSSSMQVVGLATPPTTAKTSLVATAGAASAAPAMARQPSPVTSAATANNRQAPLSRGNTGASPNATANNSNKNNRRSSLLDSTVAAATSLAVAADATTTTPRNATTSTGSSIYTSGGGGSGGTQSAAKSNKAGSRTNGIIRLSWPSLMMGHQEIQDYCYHPQQQREKKNSTTCSSNPDGDDDSSAKQLLPANLIPGSSSPIIDDNQARNGISLLDNQHLLASNSSEESSFNDESSIMNGEEGDGIINLSHFESLRNNNRCLGGGRSSNGGGGGAATAHASTRGGGDNNNNNNNIRSSRALAELGRYARRRRRMQWMIFVALALLTLLLMTILVPRTVGTARHAKIENGVTNPDDASVNNNDLSGGGSNTDARVPTLAPTLESAILNEMAPNGGTNSHNNDPSSVAPPIQNHTDGNVIHNSTEMAPPSMLQPIAPTDFPRARFQPTMGPIAVDLQLATIQPSPEPTPQLIKDTPTMRPIDAGVVVDVVPPTLSPTVSQKEEQDGQVSETELTPIDLSRPWFRPSPEPTPQLVKDTPTISPVEAVAVQPPTFSPVVPKKADVEEEAQVVDETEVAPVNCFPDAATLPLDSSILQASLMAPGLFDENSSTLPSSNHRPTFPFCSVPPNADWSSLIRFGPQQWFSVSDAPLPALVEICMDQTTRNVSTTDTSITSDNDNSDSPFALNDETIVTNNLNFVRPFLVLFDSATTAGVVDTCSQQEQSLSCQAVTEFVVPASAVGSPISSDNHDIEMLANDMHDAEAEHCQSIYYPGLDNVNADNNGSQRLLLLAGVYGYSRRVDDILSVDFTISAKTNNACSNAIPFGLAATKTSVDTLVIQGSTESVASSSQDMALPPCGSTSTSAEAVPGVWYEIQGTGEMLRLSTCNSLVENIITIYTTTMTDQSESTDTVCENLQCITDDEQSLYREQACPATGGGGNSVVFSTQTNQVYFVRIHPKVVESSYSRTLTSHRFTYEEDHVSQSERKQLKSSQQTKGKKQSSKKKYDDEVVMEAQEAPTAIGGPFELTYQEDKDAASMMVAAQSLSLCMQAKEIVLGTEQGHMYSWLTSQQDESTTLYNEMNVVQDVGLLSCTDQLAVTMNGPSKWYSFVGDGEEVYINTCSDLDDATLTDFESILSVYSGESCNELACVEPTADIALARSAGFRCSLNNDSHISFVTEPGKRYYVVVHGVNGQLGDFRLKFGHTSCLVLGAPMETPMQATGDVRVGLLANGLQPQNLVVKSNTGEAATIQTGRFFAYYGTGGIMIASTCNGISDFEAQLSVYSGKCSTPVQIAHYESPLSCGSGREVYWKSEAGQYYYIHVSASTDELQVQATTSLGKFGLMVSSGGGDVCSTAFGPVVPAVADDDESSAASNYWALEGWTVPTLVDPVDGCGAAASEAEVYGKWYRTTGTGSTMELYTSFAEHSEGAYISVFRGSCEDLECVDYNDSDGKVAWKSRAGEFYYILVASASSAAVQESSTFSVSFKQWNNACEYTTEAYFEALPTDGTVVHGRTMGWSEYTFAPPTPTITYVSNCAVSEIANDGRNAWYTVVGTNSTLVASACSRSATDSSLDVIVLEERTLDSGCSDLVGVSSSTSSPPVVVAANNHDNTNAPMVDDTNHNTACAVSWQAEHGKLYRLVLRAAEETDRGRFGISVMESNTQPSA